MQGSKSLRYVEITDTECSSSDESENTHKKGLNGAELETFTDDRFAPAQSSDLESEEDEPESKPAAQNKPRKPLKLLSSTEEDRFLSYLEPMIESAFEDRREKLAIQLAKKLWEDRFPNSLPVVEGLRTVNMANDLELWGVHFKERVKMGPPRRRYPRHPYDKDWEHHLSLEHDRDKREYLTNAEWGKYLTGHQYDVVITAEMRKLIELSPEELLERSLKQLMEAVRNSCRNN
ncbi:hypothetical protein H0H93_013185 [Arthromyces matolae]|nr:hypothetical protein H0H93_013185 [Arthromyces matolae]